jgi:hypothetical protein
LEDPLSRFEHVADDRLLDLVNGLLAEPVAAEACEHLRACRACAERLRAFAATHERGHARAARMLAEILPLEPIAGARSGTGGGASEPGAPRAFAPRPMFPRRTLAAAASVIVVGGAVLLWAALRPAPLALEGAAWLPAPDPSILTRDSTAARIDGRILRGLEAYRNLDPATALRLLERARATGPLEQVRRVYLGNAQLLTGNPRAAIATLSDVDFTLVPEPWQSEAQWSLAEALARIGRNGAADSLRRALAERSGEVGERARRILATPPLP